MQKFYLRNLISNFGFLFNIHKPSKLPNVLIFSTPRSGSTWLQEIIWSQPKFKYVNEPLNLKGKWLKKKSKINGFKELYSSDVKKKLLNYFEGFVSGSNHFMNPNPLRKNSRFFTSRIVFKVIHGGESYINDIAKATNSKIVYLIRNPIAVALSRQQIPRVKELGSEYCLSKLNKEEKIFAKHILGEGTDMEKKIMLWCIQNKIALQNRLADWLIISYEELTCFPGQTLLKIFKHCKLNNLGVMHKNINIPSAVTIQSDDKNIELMKKGNSSRKNLINKWRNKVSNSEKNKYFEICEKMNFKVYNETTIIPNFEFI